MCSRQVTKGVASQTESPVSNPRPAYLFFIFLFRFVWFFTCIGQNEHIWRLNHQGNESIILVGVFIVFLFWDTNSHPWYVQTIDMFKQEGKKPCIRRWRRYLGIANNLHEGTRDFYQEICHKNNYSFCIAFVQWVVFPAVPAFVRSIEHSTYGSKFVWLFPHLICCFPF